MRKITIKTDQIGMVVDFEAAVVHLSNFLPKVRSTHGISSVETGLEVYVNNQDGRFPPYAKITTEQ